MIFVFNKLKYDTSKMELISDKCEMFASGEDVKLWRSNHGRWLLTYKTASLTICARTLLEGDAATLLLKYDLDKYEELFEELEEA